MLVDGDLLVYKITSGIEEPINWGNDVWTLHADLKLAKQLWKQSIGFYLGYTNSKDCLICLFFKKVLEFIVF